LWSEIVDTVDTALARETSYVWYYTNSKCLLPLHLDNSFPTPVNFLQNQMDTFFSIQQDKLNLVVDNHVVLESSLNLVVDNRAVLESPFNLVVDNHAVLESPLKLVVDNRAVLESPLNLVVDNRAVLESPLNLVVHNHAVLAGLLSEQTQTQNCPDLLFSISHSLNN
jgi:hypothetical protein